MRGLKQIQIDRFEYILTILLLAILLVSCATIPHDVSQELDKPVNVDISQITYQRQRESLPVAVKIINPTQVYRFPWKNIGSQYVTGTHFFNMKIGEGLASASPLIWGQYFNIQNQWKRKTLTIQMGFTNVSGEGMTDLSRMKAFSSNVSASVYQTGRLELTLLCRLLSMKGEMVAEFSSPQTIAITNSNDVNIMEKITNPSHLIVNGFNDILPRFFGDARVLSALKASSEDYKTATIHTEKRHSRILDRTQRQSSYYANPTNVWAVVIGISKYKYSSQNGLENLIFADDDAKAFARTLQNLGWSESHIKILINEEATQRNILIALESWLTKAGPNDQIVLFWAGHGFPDPEYSEKVYFACYDTDIKIPATGYRMDRVRSILEERNTKNVIVLVDTCHAGKIITRGNRGISIVPNIEKMRREQNIPKGWIFMVGADTDRKAIEHTSWTNGAFTHSLLKGLSGEADGFQSSGNVDGVVTLGELRSYMNTAMPDETQKVLGVAKRPVITTSAGDPDIWNLTLQAK